ncbi:NAD-dependent epimerase/dehydratase family protein [Brevibacillus choshinensis]|uniref:NAD-dependent epimerase/dehydratase family protein n=1 Tax=Brevibacillus choshinensis TaxID=54911 RepID=A0ABX7FPM1_BRECH|nr:NAD-dependent epimerase/dehydratase family protein [Brevibacillus choshinensis]QRG68087.1 NAD-dependent epimerase/dehydratase family protein [Brevibacillus choshinensis]
MKILFLGGTRFIGPHAVKRMAELGHEIVVYNRGQSSDAQSLPKGVASLTGDRARLGESRDAFRAFSPDVVVDLFPYSEADARQLMETFSGIAGRVVAISSCDVYQAFGRVNRIESGPPEEGALTEQSPLCEKRYPLRGARADLSDYDKVLVERVVMSHESLPGTILRLPMVYGPGDYQHRLYPYLQQMRDGRSVILMEEGFASWRWSRGYVEDIAEAICLAALHEKAAGQIYHVGEEFGLPMREWVERIAAGAGWRGEIVTVPAADLPPHLVMDIETGQHIQLDTSKIRSELGYAERLSPEEAMSRTIAWESANPPENVAWMIDYTAEDDYLARLGVK